jgi:hypothetical protein
MQIKSSFRSSMAGRNTQLEPRKYCSIVRGFARKQAADAKMLLQAAGRDDLTFCNFNISVCYGADRHPAPAPIHTIIMAC